MLRKACADEVMDDQRLADQYGGRDAIPAEAWAQWQRDMKAKVAKHQGPHVLWVIRGNPAPIAPGVRVDVLNPGADECHRRADRDGRPAVTHEWIDRWFARYAGF